LTACQLRGVSEDTALLYVDLVDSGCEPLALAGATIDLTARAWVAMAEHCGQPIDDFAATIGGGYADAVGADNVSALVCYASAMAAGGAIDLRAAALSRAVDNHGEMATVIAGALLLAVAWQWQAKDEGCTAADIALRMCAAAG
jgi:hypothetical protein